MCICKHKDLYASYIGFYELKFNKLQEDPGML